MWWRFETILISWEGSPCLARQQAGQGDLWTVGDEKSKLYFGRTASATPAFDLLLQIEWGECIQTILPLSALKPSNFLPIWRERQLVLRGAATVSAVLWQTMQLQQQVLRGDGAAAFELRLSAVPPLWPCAACMRLGLRRSRAVFGIDKRLDLATRTLLMRLPAVPDQGQLLRTLVSSSWSSFEAPLQCLHSGWSAQTQLPAGWPHYFLPNF